jgi:hypothetical protein
MLIRGATAQEKRADRNVTCLKSDRLPAAWAESLSANDKPAEFPLQIRVFLAKAREKWHKLRMCFHATISGAILPIWSKTAYDEVMLHCARIGFKP